MMKRLLSLCVALVATILIYAETINGTCGVNVTWSLDIESGVLNIMGSGAMTDYASYSNVPWYSNRTSVQTCIVEDGVTTIGKYAFYDCSLLSAVDIPSTVTMLKESSFRKCIALTSVSIPSSVTEIGWGAFYSCTGLESINIPFSVTTIGDYAFQSCINLNSITLPSSVQSIGAYAFQSCSSICGTITIPSLVTSIKSCTFDGCHNISAINIPSSIRSIESCAFQSCRTLTSITIPESVTSIGNDAFRNCYNLLEVSLPNSISSLNTNLFYNCTSLTSITIPNSVTSIKSRAFCNCSSLTSITIPNSVTSIESDAFYQCSGLTSIVVELGNSKYDSRNNCNAIIETASNVLICGCKNTIIPNSVTKIGYLAFAYCSGLSSITIPSSVSRIESMAFYNCSNLACVTCEAVNPPTLAYTNAFPSVDIAIYVPCGSLETYRQRWSSFTNIQETGCEPEEYTRSVTPGRYGTICLPKAVAHEDIQGGVFFKIVYAVTNTNDEVTGILMEEETEGLEAGKPYIFRATADELVLPYTGEAVADPVAANGLVGNLSETPLDVPQGMYVLSNNQIRKLAGGTATAGQNRAYIDLTNVTKLNYVPTAAPNRVVLNVEGSNVATDLENIKSEDIQKVIRDGQVLILRDGKTYNVLGNTL